MPSRSSTGASSTLRRAVDEQQVQAVADAEPVEARLDERLRLRGVGSSPYIEDTAALGVGERPDPVGRGLPGQLGGRLAAAAQDHERQDARERDEDPGALAVGRAGEPDGRRRQPRVLERRPEDLVDEHGDRSERRAARAEHGGVQGLQQLPGDVDRDVRPRLEVRADGADRDAAHRDLQAVVELPRVLVALERRQRRELRELLGERVDARGVEPEPVERALVEPVRRRDVGGVRRRRSRRARSPTSCAARSSACVTASSVSSGTAAAAARGFALEVVAQRHPVFLSPAAMPAIERSSGCTAASSPAR